MSRWICIASVSALLFAFAGTAGAQEPAVVQGLTREGRMSRADARELARRVHERLLENARRGPDRYDPLRQRLGVVLFGGPGNNRAEYDERLRQVVERLGEGLTRQNLEALFGVGDGAALRCAELFEIAMTQCDALMAAASRQRRDLPYLAPDPGTELENELTSAGASRERAGAIVRGLSAGLLSVPASLDRSTRGAALERLIRACPGGLPDRDSQVRAWHVGPTSGLARCLGRAAGREGQRAASLLTTAFGLDGEAAVALLRWAHGQPVREQAPVLAMDQLMGQAARAYRANRFAEAARLYEQATVLDPVFVAAHQGLAVSRLRAGDSRGAADAYRAAARLAPRSADIQVGLARALTQLRDREGAAAAYRLALSLEPGRADATRELAALAPSRAPAPAPVPAAAPDLRAQARSLFAARRFAEAERAYRQIVQGAPNDAAAHAGLGASLLALGRRAEAVLEYRRATELDPRNAGFVAALGGAFEAAGDLESARAAYQHALRLDPSQRGAQERLARLAPARPAASGPTIAAQAHAPALPETPSREEIVRALAPLESRLEACAPAIDSVVTFRILMRGAVGTIGEVELLEQVVSAEERACMEAHIGHARLPPFSRPELEIRYPYSLRGPQAPDEAPPPVDAD